MRPTGIVMSALNQERTRWFLRNILPHEPALRSWLARRQPCGLDADDIIQECYAIFADLASVEEIRSPRAYLFQVARSVITKHVRRARVVSIHTVSDLTELDQADDGPSPERVAIYRDQLRRLAAAIGGMPPKTQEAFILRRVDGLSQREISTRMAISENIVEKHISRGLRFLIDSFGHGGKPLAEASKRAKPESAPLNDRPGKQLAH